MQRSHSLDESRALSGPSVDFIKKLYPTKIPIAAITAISKLFCKKEPVYRETPMIKRVTELSTHVNTAKFVEYLSNDTHYEKGKQLQDNQVRRVFQGNCSEEGKLTFEYLMKISEKNGISMTENTAKNIVKKYGKSKGYLNADDCLRTISKRYQNISRKKSPLQSPRNRSLKVESRYSALYSPRNKI